MTAIDELQNNKVGEEFLALLSRTIAAAAREGCYPAPGGREYWTADDVRQTVSSFLASGQTPRRLTDLRTHCRTEQALKARLQRTIKNFLADNGRRTPVGRLVRRFNEVLTGDSGFERDGIYWRLTGTTNEPTVVDFDRLVNVVAAVEVEVPSAWNKGERKSPEIERQSVVRVARAALEAAEGPLRPSDLAKLTAKRLGLGRAPLSLEAFAFETETGGGGVSHFAGPDALADIWADEVLSRLNEKETLSLGLPELSTDALSKVLGLSGSKAHLIRRRAVSILQDELGTEADGQAVAEVVLGLARIWSETWMTQHDPT